MARPSSSILSLAYCGRAALVLGPAFSEYANALSLSGAKVRLLSLDATNDFQFSSEAFLRAWADNDIAVITTPNSVTGRLIPRGDVVELARFARMNEKLLVVDETFIDFVETQSIKALVHDNPFLIVVRSLTKYYGLAGLRVGYLISCLRRIQSLTDHLEPWSVNAPALEVAAACVKDASFRSRTECWLKREKDFASRGLKALKPLQPHDSVTNFLLVRIDTAHGDAPELRSFLLGKHLLIRCCDTFAGLGARYFRIAVRRRKENQLLLDALTEWRADSPMARRVILVTGGARSGKSSYAEQCARNLGERLVYIATAEPNDQEMAQRIAEHRKRRGNEWITIEEPIEIPAALVAQSGKTDCALVDCITLWLSNLLMRHEQKDAQEKVEELINSFGVLDFHLLLVTNEVGWGIVPDNALARQFRDLAGWTNQRIAAVADQVILMVAGAPLTVKGQSCV